MDKKRMLRKMKTTAGAVLGAVLLTCALAGSAAAAEPKGMELTITIPAEYELTPPEETRLTAYETINELSGGLTATGNVEAGNYVEVTVETPPLTQENGAALSYRLKQGDAPFEKVRWSEKELRDGLTEGGEKGIPLFVEIEESQWKKAQAGEYRATLTFTAVRRTSDGEAIAEEPVKEITALTLTVPEPTPAATATPVPTEPPEVIITPEATATPTPGEEPEATATPTPGEKPEATATPTPVEKPEATATPTPREEPEATATPTPGEKPEATATPTPIEKPEATATPTPGGHPVLTATPTATPSGAATTPTGSATPPGAVTTPTASATPPGAVTMPTAFATPTPAAAPKTGDNTPLAPLGILLLASAGVILVIIRRRNRNNIE